MPDKHESKQKALRAKAHIGVPEHHAEHQDHSHLHDADERKIKEAAGNVQEELSDQRAAANHAHQG